MGNICSKHRRRNRNYQVSSTQSTPERKHELDEGGSSQYADRKACQLKVTVSEKTYQGPSTSSPLDHGHPPQLNHEKVSIPHVCSQDSGTASEPVIHKPQMLTQSGSESIQISSTDHRDCPSTISPDSSHQQQNTNLKDESVQTSISGGTSAALNTSNCTCSAENLDQILLRSNDKLITLLSNDPLGIANILLAQEFIPEDTQAQMQLGILTPQKKATILVTNIRNMIKVAPKRYNEFIGILSKQAWTKDIVDILPLSSCELHKVDLQRSTDDHSLTNLKSKLAEATASSEHSSSNEEYIFPALNSDDEAELEAQLIISANNMKKKFAALLLKAVESFNHQGMDPKLLVTGVLAMTEYDDPSIGKPLLKREKKKLTSAQDIYAVFDILRPHMTFFNYEILEFLIKTIGSKEDKEALQTYLHDFRHFCRRSVFELPKNSLGHSSEKAVGQKCFCVKITKAFKSSLLAKSKSLRVSESSTEKICAPRSGISLNDAKHIQQKLATVLKVKATSLYLDFISPGSTVLTFLIPEHVSLADLDSNPEIIALSTNGIHILCGPAGKPEPKELTPNGLTVQWSQPEYGRSSLAKYVLYYQKKCSETEQLSEWQKLELSSLEMNTCVPDLIDGETYIFKICTVSDVGTLQYSNESDPVTTSADGILVNTELGAIQPPDDTKTVEQIDTQQLFLSVVKELEVPGNTEKVKSLLQDTEIDIDIDLPDENGCTPLFIAIEQGSLEIAKILIKKKADVNTRDKNGRTILMAAVLSENLELVQMCLEELDTQEGIVNIQEKELGQTALHFAVMTGKADIVKRLMDPQLGTNINLRNKEDKTAMDLAEENTEIMKILSEQQTKKGPKISIPWIKSDIIQAVRNGSLEHVEKLLRENADPDKGDLFNWTPLMYASQKGDPGTTKLLLQYDADPNKRSDGEGWTALILASHRGHVEVVDLLLSNRFRKKCDVNIQTKRREMTALQRVCLGSRPTIWSILRGRVRDHQPHDDVVKRLLDGGADITLTDSQNRTPLIAASKSGFPTTVELILKSLSDHFPEDERKRILDLGMDGGWTALMEASEEGNTEIIKLLLEAGAAANKTKKDLDTALHVAAYHGHKGVVEILLQYMNAQDINIQNDDGMTPLMLAAKQKKAEIVRQLLETGADPSIRSKHKRTALQYARQAGRGATDVINTLEEWARTHPEQSQIA